MVDMGVGGQVELRVGQTKDQKSYVLPHRWTLDQGQTQQGDWTKST
jgi:hypothetical protein